jgi:DNA-binding Lrp family transcriptional regulator
MTEVQRAHMVTGIYDVILYVEAADLKVLGELVAERIHEIDGVSSTVTCIVVA